jgi:GTP-binding protein
LHDQALTRLKTPELNDWVQRMQDEHPAPLWRGYPVRFSYAHQIGHQPITISIQCNRPEAVDAAYRRYLTSRLRERFQLQVPIRLVFRQKTRRTPRGAKGQRA